MKVSELLTDASKWTQGASARNGDRVPVQPCADDAVAWSIGGAIIRCYARDDPTKSVRKLQLLQKRFHADTAGWNDSRKRTFNHILSMVDLYDL